MIWSYEVDVGTLRGEVEAEDREAALDAAIHRELALALDTLGASTWLLRTDWDESGGDDV